MAKDFTATISGNSERAEVWRQILGTETVNIKSPFPSVANLPGKPTAKVYELDINLLSDEQRERLVNHISSQFNLSIADVSRDLNEMGCPLLAEDLTITVHNPQKWFS
jgi:hypothetical protein